jgi:hypothetical protein
MSAPKHPVLDTHPSLRPELERSVKTPTSNPEGDISSSSTSCA